MCDTRRSIQAHVRWITYTHGHTKLTHDASIEEHTHVHVPALSVANVRVCSYAFVEYENEDDMRVAYKRGDGRKIDGRRVLVDVERGRTVRNWLVSPKAIESIVITCENGNISRGSLS